MNTYSPHIMARVMIGREKMIRVMAIASLVIVGSKIMCWVTRTELMFPERTAPKYIFDVV